MARKLSLKMRTFCLAYVGEASGNATEAARIAGYKGNDVTLWAVASENLRKPQVVSLIEELRVNAEKKLEKKIMSAAEVLAELSEIALTPWRELVEIKWGEDGQVIHAQLRLADKIKACELVGKKYKLFTDQVKIVLTNEKADELIDGAVAAHGLPVPETFGGEPIQTSEM